MFNFHSRFFVLIQELHYHQQELQLQQEQQHQQQLRYHLLSETKPDQDLTRNVLPSETNNKHFESVNKDYPNVVPTHAVPPGGERRNSQLSRRLQDEPSIASNQYSSSEGSSNNSPMLRIVGERRGGQTQSNHYRSNPHYVNTQGHHQPYLHHPSHAQYPLQYSHSGRCLENHHWELVNQVYWTFLKTNSLTVTDTVTVTNDKALNDVTHPGVI